MVIELVIVQNLERNPEKEMGCSSLLQTAHEKIHATSFECCEVSRSGWKWCYSEAERREKG